MTFLDNFKAICDARGEAYTHALIGAGLSKSLLSKWKKQPDRVPYGDTVQKLADYFGCSFSDLAPNIEEKVMTPEAIEIMRIVNRLNQYDQRMLLKYVQFTYDGYDPDER